MYIFDGSLLFSLYKYRKNMFTNILKNKSILNRARNILESIHKNDERVIKII